MWWRCPARHEATTVPSRGHVQGDYGEAEACLMGSVAAAGGGGEMAEAGVRASADRPIIWGLRMRARTVGLILRKLRSLWGSEQKTGMLLLAFQCEARYLARV